MLETLTKKEYRSRLKIFISTLIFGIILLQFSVAFLRFCPQRSSSFLLKSLCPKLPDDPAFYPFLDYPMYAGARYEGVKVNQYLLFGVLKNGTNIPITHKDLEIYRYNLLRKIIPEIQEKNLSIIQQYVKIYEQNSHKNLVKLRLENHPLVITRKGVNPGEKKVILDLKV
ncbi:MAG: hypothetical protein AUK43_01550 [Oscillatoriales cyanobacterium CG2_30_40_61]|nr:MAG: hypothetical protein AUK43_01550 [Oscillatoriales cyanobacterium CG2_30_40_61]